MSETSVNKLQISGTVQDVIVRQTGKGDSVCNFSLVVIDRVKDEKTFRQFIKCTAWRGLAKRVAEMTVGQRVRVVGRLETASWDDRETGKRKYRLQIVCDECEPVSHLQQPPDQAAIDRRPIDESDIPF
jgi:single-strand DNA-binding protein